MLAGDWVERSVWRLPGDFLVESLEFLTVLLVVLVNVIGSRALAREFLVPRMVALLVVLGFLQKCEGHANDGVLVAFFASILTEPIRIKEHGGFTHLRSEERRVGKEC